MCSDEKEEEENKNSQPNQMHIRSKQPTIFSETVCHISFIR